MIQQGDYIYEYDPTGQMIYRHNIWRILENEIILIVKVSVYKPEEGTKLVTKHRKFDITPLPNGQLKEHRWKRGKKNTFFIKTPKVERDFITWQLKEHIIHFVRKTGNIALLQDIYRELKEHIKAQQVQEQQKKQEAPPIPKKEEEPASVPAKGGRKTKDTKKPDKKDKQNELFGPDMAPTADSATPTNENAEQ